MHTATLTWKNRLQEHFGKRIVQSEINSKLNAITFKPTARKGLQDYNRKQQQENVNTAEEKN